jgi:hypothetical protein
MTGSSTCVIPQPRQRARRGRRRTTTPPMPRTVRATANPHRASGPPHPGQRRPPAASRRSTETGWSSTVSTAPPSATHGPLGPCRKDHREGRCISMVGTVSSPTDARYSPDDTPDPSAPSVPETSPSMSNFTDAQHLERPPSREQPPGRGRPPAQNQETPAENHPRQPHRPAINQDRTPRHAPPLTSTPPASPARPDPTGTSASTPQPRPCTRKTKTGSGHAARQQKCQT